MWFSAFVRDKKTNQKHLIEDASYISKKEFSKDLRSNGYAVIRISNKQDIAAQNMNFSSLDVLKKERNFDKKHGFNIEKYDEMIKEIEGIEL